MELTVGQIVEGKITGITNFGVFADLGEGKSGMVHISEVARTYVSDIKEFVKVGDVLKMKVLNVGEDGKISLSIKRALEPEKTSAPKERGERRTFQQPAVIKGISKLLGKYLSDLMSFAAKFSAYAYIHFLRPPFFHLFCIL